jgi:hypothetical protein
MSVFSLAKFCARMHVASIRHLPVWQKSIIAPMIVLLAMFVMTGVSLFEIADQTMEVTELDSLAFESSRQAMVTTVAVADFQTELYHLTSTGANEADRQKVEATAQQLLSKLDAIVLLIPQQDIMPNVGATFCGIPVGRSANDRVRPPGPSVRRYDDGLCGGVFPATPCTIGRNY